MPEIQAFRGLRYDLGRVGSLSDVVAPPYDVIDPELQEQLYCKHPCNVVRLILNRIEPGDDDEANNRYTRAKRLLKDWQSGGVLFHEPDPAVYVYEQEFVYENATYARRGIMARLRLSRFGEGQVFPHEETLSGPKIDRLMLTTRLQGEPQPGLRPLPGPERPDGEDSRRGNRQDHPAGRRRSPGRGQSALARYATLRPSPPWPRRSARSRSSSPTAITATRPRATIATMCSKAANSRPTIRPTSC